MSLMKFGFSTSKINVQAAKAPAITNEQRQVEKKEYEKKRERKYREEWEKDFPWLRFNADENTMHCAICRDFPRISDNASKFFTGSSTFRIHYVQSHGQSSHHAQCLAAANARDNPRDAPLNAQVLRMEAGLRDRLIHIFDLGYFVVRRELPFSVFPDLMSVSRKIGADVGDSYSSDQALRRFIPFMYHDLHDEFVAELNGCRYISVLADSSTDCSIRDLELVYVRHLRDGKPRNSYVSIEELQHAHAHLHMQCMDNAMSNHVRRDWKQHLVGMGSDGASVMVGRNGGVAALLAADVPYIITIHCLAHKLELGAADAIKDQQPMKQITDVLDGIYKHYHYSPKAWRELKGIADLIDQDVRRPSNLKGTRWLPHISRAMDSLLHAFQPIITHFEHTVEDGASSATMLGRARLVTGLLKNFRSLLFMFFLKDCLDILSVLSTKFQEDGVTISSCIQALETATLSFTSLKYEAGQHQERFLNESAQGVYKTVELVAFNDASRATFNTQRDRVVDSLVNHLSIRFRDFETNEVISAGKILNIREWPAVVVDLAQFGNGDVAAMCNHFRPILDRNGCDTNQVRHREWPDLKTYIRRQANVQDVQDVWANLLRDPDLRRRFPNILHLIEILLVLPMSTATCERGFSTLKRIKSDWRSNLMPEMLHMLMYICIEGCDSEQYNAARAMERWWDGGERQRRPQQN